MTWYCLTKPPIDATSETPGTFVIWYRTYQSCIPLSSARLYPFPSMLYSKTQPTPVASGPRDGVTPFGSLPAAKFRYSKTRERAQYISVPSSKMIYTKETPKKEKPLTTLLLGTASIAVVRGYVIWSSTTCGAWPGYSV